MSEGVYLDELPSADLRGVVVVGEGDVQHASLHLHCGLKTHRLESSYRPFITLILHYRTDRQVRVSLDSFLLSFPSFLPSYLEFLPSDGLHVTLLANGELVGDLGVLGVELSPGEVISILGHLCDQLVVPALLDDVIRDTWRRRLR